MNRTTGLLGAAAALGMTVSACGSEPTAPSPAREEPRVLTIAYRFCMEASYDFRLSDDGCVVFVGHSMVRALGETSWTLDGSTAMELIDRVTERLPVESADHSLPWTGPTMRIELSGPRPVSVCYSLPFWGEDAREELGDEAVDHLTTLHAKVGEIQRTLGYSELVRSRPWVEEALGSSLAWVAHDGVERLVVGASGGPSESTRLVAFRPGADVAWVPTTELDDARPAAGAGRIGENLAGAGDLLVASIDDARPGRADQLVGWRLSADGWSRVLLATAERGGLGDAGPVAAAGGRVAWGLPVLEEVRVFSAAPSSEGEPTGTLRGDDGSRFGAALSMSAKWLAIGAPGEDEERGAVLVYGLECREPDFFARLSPPAGAAPRFGRTLALDGDRLLVGSAGAAVVWDLARGTAVDLPRTTDSRGFGHRVALRGSEALVTLADMESEHGEVHVYREGERGDWNLQEVVTLPGLGVADEPRDSLGHDGFGSALLLTADRVWIGAPEVLLNRSETFGVVVSAAAPLGPANAARAWSLVH